jgi:hypothetical protein
MHVKFVANHYGQPTKGYSFPWSFDTHGECKHDNMNHTYPCDLIVNFFFIALKNNDCVCQDDVVDYNWLQNGWIKNP